MTLYMYDKIINTADVSFAVKEATSVQIHFRNGTTTGLYPPSKQKNESAADYHKRMNKQLNEIMERVDELMNTDDRLYARVGAR